MRTPLILLALALCPFAGVAAQTSDSVGEVFLARELPTPPRLLQSHAKYYSDSLFDRAARVRITFVVDTIGHTERRSMKVVQAPDATFAEAARLTILAREYSPGEIRGIKVRAVVSEELRFVPGTVSCVHIIASLDLGVCVDSLASQ